MGIKNSFLMLLGSHFIHNSCLLLSCNLFTGQQQFYFYSKMLKFASLKETIKLSLGQLQQKLVRNFVFQVQNGAFLTKKINTPIRCNEQLTECSIRYIESNFHYYLDASGNQTTWFSSHHQFDSSFLLLLRFYWLNQSFGKHSTKFQFKFLALQLRTMLEAKMASLIKYQWLESIIFFQIPQRDVLGDACLSRTVRPNCFGEKSCKTFVTKCSMMLPIQLCLLSAF